MIDEERKDQHIDCLTCVLSISSWK